MLAGKISGTDLSAIASEYSASVQTASDVVFSSSSVPGIGTEPEVIAAAFAQAEGGVSAPVRGNNGVYIVKTTSKTEGTVGNIPAARRSLTNANRSRSSFSLLTALKDLFKAEDNRSKFF